LLREATFRRFKGSLVISLAAAGMAGLLTAQTVADVQVAAGVFSFLSGALAAGAVCVVARVWFVRIVAEPQGVRLVNWFGSRRLAWSDITSIDPPTPYGRLINRILFTTTDGKVHVATAFSPGPLDAASVTSGVVAELRGLHARYRTPPPPAGA
jgi:hypothetical protein